MAREEDLEINQGADFGLEIHLGDENEIPLDLTNVIVQGGLKRSYTSKDYVPFNITVKDITGGVILISLTNEITETLKRGKYVYDVEIITPKDNGVVKEKILRGVATINLSVT